MEGYLFIWRKQFKLYCKVCVIVSLSSLY